MPDLAYINGRVMPLREAMIPVEDRGFQFGDSVYEVICAFRGEPFLLDRHIHRLRRSLREIRLDPGSRLDRIEHTIRSLVNKSRYREALVYVQITRGRAPRGHAFPAHSRPTVVVTVRRKKPVPGEVRSRGVPLVSEPDIRWGRCDIKSTQLLSNVLLKQKALEADAYEVLFFRPGGWITEGSSTNFFAVHKGVLFTHPATNRLLPGVTRALVIELAKEAGMIVRERAVRIDHIRRWTEAFITSTTSDVVPVVRIDDRVVGAGRPGPVARELYEAILQRARSK